MAPSKKDDGGIPSWQRAYTSPSSSSPELESGVKPEKHQEESEEMKTAEGSSGSLEALSNEVNLLDQASKFLQDPSIQNASRDKKVAFLESKGISRTEADKLVGPDIQKVSEVVKEAETEPAKPVTPSVAIPPATTKTAATTTSATAPAPATTTGSKDIPPIITYPEFLVHQSKPPPLVSAKLLWNILYASGTTAAMIYGASKFLIQPLVETLSENRHDVFSHTQEHLTALNERLAENVTAVPSVGLSGTDAANREIDQLSDTSSDSDPTELFHRDIGVQTSPNLSRRGSTASLTDAPGSEKDTVSRQEAKLQSISERLRELIESGKTAKSGSDTMDDQVRDLGSYLTELTYSSPYYGMSGLNSFNYSLNPGGAVGGTSKVDAIDAVKADIRGVKGVLLSSRNFPSARAAVR